MTDIIERLSQKRTVDGSVIYVEVLEEDVDEAISEIQRLRATIEELRSIAGAANIDRPFSAIKLTAKFGSNPVLGEYNDGK